jgi:HSP20 family protein
VDCTWFAVQFISAKRGEGGNMAEKTREERQLALNRPGWGGGPFRTLQRMVDEMDRVIDDFGFGRRWSSGRRELGAEMWAPDVEVFQKNNELTVRADLPGLKRDEVTVEVTDQAVTIQGERKREQQQEQEGIYRSERSYGSFWRVIPLPEGAITEQAKATFRDGVLEITMPVPPPSTSKGRRLEIAEGAKK